MCVVCRAYEELATRALMVAAFKPSADRTTQIMVRVEGVLRLFEGATLNDAAIVALRAADRTRRGPGVNHARRVRPVVQD